MGPQVLIIPALFVTICISFIVLQSCYHKWKVGALLRKKRDAAKVSLVNILQMTNPSLITPAWSSLNGAVKSKIRPTLLVSEDKGKEKCNSPSTFDPRNPNVLSSSALTLGDSDIPPPCYEDLYGPGGVVFTFKSLSPDREEPPPFSTSNGSTGQQCSNNENNSCFLQIPSQEISALPSTERRNSSAVLYL